MPDIGQIKQGEQATMPAMEGPVRRFAGFPSVRIVDVVEAPHISDSAITALAVIWLQKQPGEAEGDLGARFQKESLPAADLPSPALIE